jgi:hypothetical protein
MAISLLDGVKIRGESIPHPHKYSGAFFEQPFNSILERHNTRAKERSFGSALFHVPAQKQEVDAERMHVSIAGQASWDLLGCGVNQ